MNRAVQPDAPMKPPAQDEAELHASGWLRLVGLCVAVLGLWAISLWLYPYSSLTGLGLRYLLLPLLSLVGCLAVGARYLQWAYQLDSSGQALQYLLAGLFGFRLPHLVVADGTLQEEAGQVNLVERIGGPGHLVVQPGNVVLLENLAGGTRVVGPGRHYVRRLETIKAVMGLEEQDALVERMSATTKDGIPLEVREVRFRYRLWTESSEAGQPQVFDQLHRFSVEAVQNAVYNRNMRQGQIATWHDGVKGVIESAITEYIQQHFVDQLTAPVTQGQDPRREIYQRLHSGSVRERLRERGAELRWIDIGHFDLPEKQVTEQRVSAWQTRWVGNANLVRAYGEAQRLAYQELGRAEAQAELLMSIVQALEDVEKEGDSRQQLRKMVLARIAGLLDAMRAQVALPEGEKD